MVIKELNNAKKAYQRKDFKAADEIYSKIIRNISAAGIKNFMH